MARSRSRDIERCAVRYRLRSCVGLAARFGDRARRSATVLVRALEPPATNSGGKLVGGTGGDYCGGNACRHAYWRFREVPSARAWSASDLRCLFDRWPGHAWIRARARAARPPVDRFRASRSGALLASGDCRGLAVLLTGIINTSIPCKPGFFGQNGLWLVLIAKICLFLCMVTLALINRRLLLPNLLASSGADEQNSAAALWRVVGAEQALGFLIVILVSILGMLPPPH